MLAQLVKDGKLPAVDARLPKKPAVLKGAGRHRQVWRHVASSVQRRVRSLGAHQVRRSDVGLV